MRVLFDVVHPAHVHFYRHLHGELAREGHATLVVARDKDVTLELLDAFRIPHVSIGRPRSKGLLRRGAELVRRDIVLWRHARQFRPDVILTRNPAGVQAARLARVLGVFDTDDGSAVGIHFYAAKPFAHIITSPDCLTEDYGARHRTYPGYKALAYLHPDRFTPDVSIRAELGLSEGDPLYFLRFAAHSASHDRHIEGMPENLKREVVRTLATRGRVVISSEADLAPDLEPYRRSVAANRVHDLIAAATLCVGDSQTVAAEAAVLGTPAIRMSSFSGRVDYLRELEERYGLIANFRPGEDQAMLAEIESALDDSGYHERRVAAARARMLSEKTDVTSWYRELLADIVG